MEISSPPALAIGTDSESRSPRYTVSAGRTRTTRPKDKNALGTPCPATRTQATGSEAMIPTPGDIKAYLDRYVVGQDKAKWTLAVAVSNHYRAAAYQGSTRISKNNIIVLGPTGSGKTFVVQTIARMLKVPFASTSATAITPPGWAGADPEQCIKDLVAASRRLSADNKIDWDLAQQGIVYIDEIDKLAEKRHEGSQVSSGFTNVSVQQSLLKIVEGDIVVVGGTPMTTDKILFIASGAFVGLDQKVMLREAKGRLPSRPKPDPHALRRTIPQDLIEFGLIPEFVGRFPVVAALDVLSIDDLVHVLRDVDDSLLSQVTARASVTGSNIEFDDMVVRWMAQMAVQQGTGARGLRTMLEKKLEDVWRTLGDNEHIRITAEGMTRSGVPSEPSEDGLAEASETSATAPQKEDT